MSLSRWFCNRNFHEKQTFEIQEGCCMNNDTLSIVQKANKIVKLCGTRDPYRIADQLGIGILHCNFQTQKGASKFSYGTDLFFSITAFLQQWRESCSRMNLVMTPCIERQQLKLEVFKNLICLI